MIEFTHILQIITRYSFRFEPFNFLFAIATLYLCVFVNTGYMSYDNNCIILK